MKALMQKRLANLLAVKSIVTILLTGVFAYLAISGKMDCQHFLTVFSVIIAFYFGTQSQRLNDRLEPGQAKPGETDPSGTDRETVAK